MTPSHYPSPLALNGLKGVKGFLYLLYIYKKKRNTSTLHLVVSLLFSKFTLQPFTSIAGGGEGYCEGLFDSSTLHINYNQQLLWR